MCFFLSKHDSPEHEIVLVVGGVGCILWGQRRGGLTEKLFYSKKCEHQNTKLPQVCHSHTFSYSKSHYLGATWGMMLNCQLWSLGVGMG